MTTPAIPGTRATVRVHQGTCAAAQPGGHVPLYLGSRLLPGVWRHSLCTPKRRERGGRERNRRQENPTVSRQKNTFFPKRRATYASCTRSPRKCPRDSRKDERVHMQMLHVRKRAGIIKAAQHAKSGKMQRAPRDRIKSSRQSAPSHTVRMPARRQLKMLKRAVGQKSHAMAYFCGLPDPLPDYFPLVLVVVLDCRKQCCTLGHFGQQLHADTRSAAKRPTSSSPNSA